MFALAAALLLAQTYPILTNSTVTYSNVGNISVSALPQGEVDLFYSQPSVSSAGNLMLTLTPVTWTGAVNGTTQALTITPGTTGNVIALTNFAGGGVVATWSVSGPNDIFPNVSLLVVMKPTATDGGGSTGQNSPIDGGAAQFINLGVGGEVCTGQEDAGKLFTPEVDATLVKAGALTCSTDAGITGNVLVGGQLVVGTTDIIAAIRDAGAGGGGGSGLTYAANGWDSGATAPCAGVVTQGVVTVNNNSIVYANIPITYGHGGVCACSQYNQSGGQLCSMSGSGNQVTLGNYTGGQINMQWMCFGCP